MSSRNERSELLIAHIEAIAFWSPRLPNWEVARAALRGERSPVDPTPRPSPILLAPTERRRAPDTVALALQVASQASCSANRSPQELNSVFASTYGDLAISDYLCSTLAQSPELLSPTKFHNSVHNAAAGYWSIGTGAHTPYTAISAGDATFAMGLLEAVVQVQCDQRPVLFVAYDIDARGPLATMVRSQGMFAAALVLSASEARGRALSLCRAIGDEPPSNIRNAAVADCVSGAALAVALPFFEAVATSERSFVSLRLGERQLLQIEIQ